MQAKLFEVRDRATFIPVLCVSISGQDGYLAKSAGFAHPMIYFVWLDRQAAKYDSHSWSEVTRARTIPIAHQYIERNFHKLNDHDVVDVEFILGETTFPKISQSKEDADAPTSVSGQGD